MPPSGSPPQSGTRTVLAAAGKQRRRERTEASTRSWRGQGRGAPKDPRAVQDKRPCHPCRRCEIEHHGPDSGGFREDPRCDAPGVELGDPDPFKGGWRRPWSATWRQLTRDCACAMIPALSKMVYTRLPASKEEAP